jgi:NADPH-dependent 2,4-dienoyl-CoA reductase/sulfur reductase-like enzyme
MRLLIIGGSDGGIMAGLRAREVDPTADVQLIVADSYPNFSICGIPYHVAGEVPDWRSLAHRTRGDLKNAGLELLLDHTATAIDPQSQTVTVTDPGGQPQTLDYDRLVIATGAVPLRPPIAGLDVLGPADGVHLLHTMGDTFDLTETITKRAPASAVIVGAGYIGMEMAEALTRKGVTVTVIEQLAQVLPRTLDPQLAAEVEAELGRHGVTVRTGTTVSAIGTTPDGGPQIRTGAGTTGTDLVLVAAGVRPDTALAAAAGVPTGAGHALAVDRGMRTSLPHVFAAGDCVHTHHRFLHDPLYLPLGTTAHKQGRVAGENAAGGDATFAGTLGTQVVRIFGRVAAATGLRDPEARQAGYDPVTVAAIADDHKAYYPGATPIQMRITGDRSTGRLLGGQLVGHLGAEIAKRIDILATAISYGATVADLPGLDLSYTPPLGSPWDVVQVGAQAWTNATPPARPCSPNSLAGAGRRDPAGNENSAGAR